MNEASDPRAWIKNAEEDYELARSALRRKKPLTAREAIQIMKSVRAFARSLLGI